MSKREKVYLIAILFLTMTIPHVEALPRVIGCIFLAMNAYLFWKEERRQPDNTTIGQKAGTYIQSGKKLRQGERPCLK